MERPMFLWGKLIGGALGFWFGGFWGAILGVLVGHQLDRAWLRVSPEGRGRRERTQVAFFEATFSVMGAVAKSDGRVSENEIAFARSVMDRMSLSGEQRQLAIRLFTEGKQPDFPLDRALARFRRACNHRRTLIQMFLEIQLQAAFADGRLDAAERELLLHIFGRLGFSARQFSHLETIVRAASHFGGAGSWEDSPRRPTPSPRPDRIQEAYQVLGVERDASDSEVTRAYRRLMSQHHPDKLVAKGLPEEMIKLANERTQEIREAYDTVREVRGIA
jgi:DnaJ like chaperone protein